MFEFVISDESILTFFLKSFILLSIPFLILHKLFLMFELTIIIGSTASFKIYSSISFLSLKIVFSFSNGVEVSPIDNGVLLGISLLVGILVIVGKPVLVGILGILVIVGTLEIGVVGILGKEGIVNDGGLVIVVSFFNTSFVFGVVLAFLGMGLL